MKEEGLMTAVKHGDLDKASALFELYHRPLYGFFFRMSRDQEVSRDLVQNVFYRMLKYRYTYGETSPFKAWIYQIARNAFVDHLRKNKMMVNENASIEKVEESEQGIDSRWEADERKQQLHKSLARLPEEDRQLLIMSKFQGMKYEEIARVTNYTVPNVKVRIHRAIKKLRDHFYELEHI